MTDFRRLILLVGVFLCDPTASDHGCSQNASDSHCLQEWTASDLGCRSPKNLPNGTAHGVHYFSCAHELSKPSLHMDILNIISSVNPQYPVNMNAPFDIVVRFNNTAATIKSAILDVFISEWSKQKNNQCGWNNFDFFGLTENMRACKKMRCPLEVGTGPPKNIHMELGDMTMFFESKTLYQMKMIMRNGDRPAEVAETDFTPNNVGCIVIQTVLV
ncbi:hypothetical protein AB6A40_001242 [Gnathostoma spinigerum]|uniref:MD-2-related lipid-recognition domain-containing protein n=1 Tax=Gnathostoma spinigerum TaxID=75299 RepID=A0ABD6ECJ4_9BILA